MTASLFFALGQVCYYLALVVKPSPYRRLWMVPIVLSTAYFYRYAVQYHTPLEYAYGCGALGQLFVASSYILTTDAQQRLFLKDQKEPAWRLSLLERVKWTIKLTAALRGIGWSHEPTHVLPPPTSTSTTRSEFVVQQIGRLTLDILLYDAIITYARGNPSFAANGYSIAGDGIVWRVVNVLVLGFGGAICIGIPYRIFSILAVSFAISEPREWPPLFGHVHDAYSLRTFWGRSWHQVLRWPGVSHGRFLAYELLHLHRKSKVAYLVQLYTTFAITALIHVGGEYTFLGYWSHRHALRFFLLQPIAITVEEFVIQTGRNLSIQGPWRLLGYLWVLAWLTYTVPGWIEPLLRGGLADTAPSLGIVSRFLAGIKL
ncbi:hypothetical protein M378DRAFT_164366 [Amanita muscaria Koide BX008]|uniref:Wax synthase domain-containing protein n=1 Tax=Amanita muscaria (strain Koide BX008) TaxID=946122 RepID=A0A0C2WPE6_AMAMK|nr:hypothetical protein M378DRAFT_164366 [Amanita muscaria Koide BX008]